MRRASLDEIEPVLVLPVVAQNILEHLIQLTEVVIRSSRFDNRQKFLAPHRRECRRLTGEPSSMTEHVTCMFAIRPLRRTIVGAGSERFWHDRVFDHKT